ncbi:MAG TPA: 30S ribosome-binding factor RbfA [Desulfurivibrionaceae bacterium]|nr:30S ribosome-binding factor RbfA [Desulfurivibrionaceae bacterium]
MVKGRSRSRSAALPGILGPAPKRRPIRVADAIKAEVAMLLLQKVKDPRLEGVNITQVTVTDDLSCARIYYTVLRQEAAADAAKGLASAKGFIRSTIAQSLNLRAVPDLVFTHDRTAVEQQRLEKLLQEIRDEDGASG